ncbi:MAG TPA: M17 family peptidase N-terminal domain-containing protein, partial [Aminivibrio sp.]|nr:M17 family peptidase N-terminal domain-containing protein [Aminivibrio sp.]
MKITASPLTGGIVSGSGAVALYVFSGESLPEGILSPGNEAAAAALLEDPSFKAKKGKIAKVTLPGSPLSRIYLVGLGERKDLGEDSLRSRTAELVRRAKGDGISRISAVLSVLPDRNASCAVGEGAELGSYSFEKYKTRKDEDRLPEPGEFVLYAGDDDGLSLGKMLACTQNMARDLANEPGNRSNPQTLAEYALAEARDFGLEVEVWDERKILEEGMEGLYSVGMGSSTPPRLVRLSWKPEGTPLRKVVFVGKG